jgi:hypothetical protein
VIEEDLEVHEAAVAVVALAGQDETISPEVQTEHKMIIP